MAFGVSLLWLLCVVLMVPPRTEWPTMRARDWLLLGAVAAVLLWVLLSAPIDPDRTFHGPE